MAAVMTLALAGLAAIAAARFAYRPDSGWQLLSMFLGLPVLLLPIPWAVYAATLRSKGARQWLPGLVVSGLTFGSCWAAPFGGKALADHQFSEQRPAFDSLVSSLRLAGRRRLLPMAPDSLPPMLRDGPRDVFARTDSTGHFVAYLFYGGGFPVKHSAYLYFDGSVDELRRTDTFWHSYRPLGDGWFDVHD